MINSELINLRFNATIEKYYHFFVKTTKSFGCESISSQPGNSGGALVDERGNVIGIVSAKLDASTALAMSGSLPENVNYAVKSSLLLSFLESVPDVDAKLKTPNTADEKFEDVVKSAQDAAVLVLVY